MGAAPVNVVFSYVEDCVGFNDYAVHGNVKRTGVISKALGDMLQHHGGLANTPGSFNGNQSIFPLDGGQEISLKCRPYLR